MTLSYPDRDADRHANRREFLGRLAGLAAAGVGWPLASAPLALGAEQPRRSILIFYAWSFHNIGDIAITPGILRLLEQHIPEAEATLVTNGRVEDYQEYLKPRFPKCRVLANPFRRKEGLPAEFREAFDKADLVLYNSGTTLSFGRWDRDWNRTIPLAIPLFMARDAGKPYGIYCQTFDRFAPPSDVLFRKVLADAAFVFARDGNSIEYLKSIQMAPPGLQFGPDSTFAFSLRDEAWADQFLASHGLEPRKFITLTIRSSIQGFIDEKREQAQAAKLHELVTTWVRKTGQTVLICPEVDLEVEPARRLIYEPLPAEVREKVRFKKEFWLPDQAFSVFARARAIVSMEMHSIILGLAAGTPVIHPRFLEAGRKAWMLRDLGVSEWLFDIDKDPADRILAATLEIDRNFEGALGKVQKAMTFVRQRQAETMAMVRKTLGL